MIRGIGVDIVTVARVEQLLGDHCHHIRRQGLDTDNLLRLIRVVTRQGPHQHARLDLIQLPVQGVHFH